ncbi:MAG: extracellular solute-binding protein [Leptolyngbyaceae cyanobacterium bins.349]|nr:extracellular solute-binding protein [Leptolyngbyaceae cyanobacterium bins.349]
MSMPHFPRPENPQIISQLKRRKFIQFASTAAIAALTSRTLNGCANTTTPGGADSPNPATSAGKTLRVLSWPGYDEPEVIRDFEQQFNVKVEFKTYIGGEQMLQFFNQSPRGTFDALISDGEYVQKLVALKALDALNPETLPEIKNYYPEYQNFPGFILDGKTMAAGTRCGVYGIAYNKKILQPSEVRSWNVLFAPELQGKVGLFDWYLPNMGNASMALFPGNENPYKLTDQQLQQVAYWMVKLKPSVSLVTSSVQDINNAFINGNIVAGPVGDWVILGAIAEGKTDFAAVVPDEGAIRWSEAAAVCADSKNKDLALEWVKYMTLPKTQAALANAKAYKGIALNKNAVDSMDQKTKELLGYIPDPNAADKLIVETNVSRTRARQLPVNQPEKAWQDIYNQFKTS